VSGAIHGDEILGVEIVRRLLRMPRLSRLRGLLVAVPVVNVYGFIARSRYLPDRRDLNRSFPGSGRGSLAARLADLFVTEVVQGSDAGVDLHTGAAHRENLPQVRATLDDPATARLARAFGAPVVLDASLRDGSLRGAAADLGVPLLVYEAGEALRFDELAIRAGVAGIVAVMRELEMLPAARRRRPRPSVVARSSVWVRAPAGGILQGAVRLGQQVAEDERLAALGDPFGDGEAEVRAPCAGVVIGRTNLPLVSEGDALYHLARFKAPDSAAEAVAAFRATLDGDPPEP
jgi:hypothetical protein